MARVEPAVTAPHRRCIPMLLAQGIDIKCAMLAFWAGDAAAHLHPLRLRLREIILIVGKIAVDDGTGAGSRSWPHQEGLPLGDRGSAGRMPIVGENGGLYPELVRRTGFASADASS